MEYKVKSDKISHVKYGDGVIVSVEKTEEGYWVTVEFEKIGEKKLLSLVDPRELS
ncbi:MAG: hypothetical protein IJO55_07880 [Lachnospiraceae bacterium]|nr:hypothetical protein [Lachnospiraceae bacterium]